MCYGDPEQDKTDFLISIESSFRLLEKAKEAALSATNSTEGSVKFYVVVGCMQPSFKLDHTF